jgi:type I restriction enzyme S subunit
MVEKLGDICAVDWGNTALTKKSYVDGGEYLAVSATGGDGRLNHYEHEASVCVLSAIGAQCGKMFFPQQRFTAIKNTITLTPKADKVVSKFLYYLFTAIELPKRGAAQPFISKGDIQNFKVPFLPPLAEQQRIVAKLDAAFAEIDTAIEVAEAKEAEVEKLKASLLSSSLAGNQGVAVMWKTVKLGEICDFEGGSQPPKKEFVYEPAEGYIRFLQIRDFKSEKNITYIPIADDILIGRYGASVGQILSGLTGAYNVALMKTIPNEEVISKGWLHAYLTSTLFQHPLMKASSRSAQNGFSKDDIYDFAVPLPPLAEQQRIVAKLDAAFAEIDSAKQAIQRAKENHAALKAAILAQELTPPTESEAA